VKLLIVSQYFWPESFLINDIAIKLAELGHEVVVATGKPNYPDGDIFKGYKGWGLQHEESFGKIKIFRVPIWPRKKGRAVHLLMNYFSFVLSGLIFFPWMLRGQHFDAILAMGLSPITAVIPGIPLKWLKRTKLTIWLQDIWPESLSATGHVQNKQIIRFVNWLVKGIYHFSDTILVQSRSFVEPVSRLSGFDKVVYFPNSVALLNPKLDSPDVPSSLLKELEKSFSIVFAGNIGTAQAVETIVEAVKKIKSETKIKLFLVGSGVCLDWVKKQKEESDLNNLYLAGRFPMSVMPAIFHRASALLVCLKDKPIFAYTIPSKVQAYLAAGRPIIASLKGEGARVVTESGAGLVCDPENAEALADRIMDLYLMSKAERDHMGASGKRYCAKNFDMNKKVQELVSILSC